MAENVTISLNVSTEKAVNSLKDFKGQMRELKGLQIQYNEAVIAGDTKLQASLKNQMTAMVQLKNDMMDTQEAMKYLDPGELLGGWVKMTQGLVGSFAAVTGAMSLFGGENEKLQEIEKKSMALIQTMMGLEQARMLLIDGGSRAQLKALFQTTAAQITYALSIKTVDKATGEVIVKQNLWNKAMKSAPIFLIIGAIAGLTVGMAALYNASKKVGDEQEVVNDLMKSATDEIAKNTVVLESHVKRLKSSYGNQDEFNKAVKDWNENIAGKYSNTLLTTSSNLYDIAKAAAEARNNIIKMGIASAAQEKISEIYAENFDYILKYQGALDKASQMEQKAAEINAKIKEEMAKNARFATTEEFRNLASQSNTYKETAENLRTYGQLQEKTMSAATIKGKAAYDQVQQLLDIVDDYTVSIDKNTASTTTNTKVKEEKEVEVIDKLIRKYDELYKTITEINERAQPDLRTPDEISAEYVNEIKGFEESTKSKLEILKHYHEEGFILEKDYQQAVADLLKEQLDKYSEYFNSIGSNLSSIFSNLTEISMIEIEKQDYAWQQSYENRNTSLNDSLEKAKKVWGEESKQYKALLQEQINLDNDKKDHDKAIEAEKKAAQNKYAKFQIGLQMAEATVAYGKGMIEAVAATITNPVWGAIMIGTLSAMYATQMALMVKQMGAIGKMRKGGFIEGPSHEQGGVLRELEGGEAVINATSMRLPGVRNVVSTINELGGGTSFRDSSSSGILTVDSQSVADAVIEAIRVIPVAVSESEITQTQKRVQVIKNKTSF